MFRVAMLADGPARDGRCIMNLKKTLNRIIIIRSCASAKMLEVWAESKLRLCFSQTLPPLYF